MALTELQLPLKSDFYANLQQSASLAYKLIGEWRGIADFIGNMGTADLDSMGVATGQVRTDLTAFRTMLNEVIAFWDGTSTSQTEVPSDVIEVIRKMR